MLPFLTPQLAGQIVQIWAVETTAFVTPRQIQRALPAPETPDYDPPQHGTPPKRAKHTQDSMKLHVANITTFGRHTLDWLWSRDNDIHIMVETHLDKQKHNTLCQYFEVRGKHAFGLPAHTNCNNDGNHGGILILHSNHHGVTQLENYHIEGCGYQAFLWDAKARSILVIAVYFKTNETIQGPTNSQLLGRLLALVEASNRQYILLKDWNGHPSQLQGTVLGSKFHWQILAPDATLLNGNVLDYALIHNQLAPLTSMTTEWAVPWRPHCLVTYALELPDDFRNYNQLRTFPALPDRPNPGFRPWTTYVTQVEEVLLYDTMPNQPAKQLADWVSVTEQYLLQQHPWAPQGRASNLQAEYKPLTSPKAGPIWKKGKPAYWEQLQVRLSHIQHHEHPSQGTIKGFLKATESAPKHWIGEPAWAQFLDMTQHWTHHRDPRTLELMQHTIQHPLTQALEQSRTEGQLQYAAWIRQGEAKGLRCLFRTLKASELAWQRPYRTVPMADRMRHRLHDWRQHWQPTTDNQPLVRDSLQASAQHQAAQLPPLTIGHLTRVLKQLPDRACGPDAISTQLLRNTPPQALPSLLQLLHDMEKSATMPTQLQMSLVVMLAKNEKVERPITLTSVLYRTWCRLRKSMLDSWQLNLPPSMDYDRARPGATALHVALERLLRQESNKTLAQHGITVLLDMSTFYDTIDLQKLQSVAQALDYPSLALEFAMQVYTGPKAVLADAELSHWFHVTHGVAAGCPQAPLLAKAFLQPILSPFQAKHPDLHLNGWVDDIGFDGSHHNPDTLATRIHCIVKAWHELRLQLTEAGLKVNNHKTAFIVTDKATHKALAKLLGPEDPPIQSVMRDLGIDHQAGRRRRISTLQNRFTKNKQRRIKLRTLRLPNLRTRLRLHRGGIQPVALWGVEGQGLAPRYRQALRQALATHLGLHSGGLTDVIYDQHQTKYLGPADQVVIQHVQALHALINHWPTEHLPQVAWMELQTLIRKPQYPWYHVKGPMAATLAYLKEWGWHTDSLYEWHRNETAFMTEAQMDLRQPWWQVEELLQAEAKQQRQHRFASRRNCQTLVSGIDWTTASKVTKNITKAQANHIRTWNQAAIRFKDGNTTKQCPLCQVPATPKHIVWLCKWHHNQKHQPLPVPWTERLQDPLEKPPCAYGWIPKEPQDSNHGKGSQSLSMPLPPPETNELRHGSMPSAFMATR